LVVQWLAGVNGAANVFRGGIVASDEAAALRALQTAAQPMSVLSGAEAHGLQPVGVDLHKHLPGVSANTVQTATVEAIASACRDRWGADFGLAIGSSVQKTQPEQLPAPACGRGAGGEGSEVQVVSLALASTEGVQQKTIPCGIHPALTRIYLAKHALNFVRLALRKSDEKANKLNQ
jgi:hypothetical protein